MKTNLLNNPLSPNSLSAIRSFITRNSWPISYLIYLLVTIFSLGFIRKLHFFGEDFYDLNLFMHGGENQPFPYHGISYLLRPLFLVFGNEPSKYFMLALMLYSILSLFLAFTVYKLSRNKMLAFFSGLAFATGYIGSESMFVVELAIPALVFLLTLLGILYLYKRFIDTGDWGSWIFALILFALSLIFISQRAHVLVFIVLLAELCLRPNKKNKSFWQFGIKKLLRTGPFIFVFLATYVGLPWVLHGSISRYLGTYWVLRTYDILSKNSYLILLSDLGNYLFPTYLQQKLVFLSQSIDFKYVKFLVLGTAIIYTSALSYLHLRLNKYVIFKKQFIIFAIFLLFNLHLIASIPSGNIEILFGGGLGYLLVTFILSAFFWPQISKKKKRLLTFFSLSWLVHVVFYHIHEANLVHASEQRYLFFGFPFFASTMSFIIFEIFASPPRRKITKYFGYALAGLIFVLYAYGAYLSSVKLFFLERSFYLKNLSSSLKNFAPQLDPGGNLFYFDVAPDSKVSGLFKYILWAGSYSPETALATLYNEDRDRIKIVYDYVAFAAEKRSGNYKTAHALFYDIDSQLHYISSLSNAILSHESLAIDNFSDTNIGFYYDLNRGNELQLKESNIIYNSNRGAVSEEPKSINDILDINIEDYNFPSYRPVRLILVMSSIVKDTTFKDNNVPLIQIYSLTDKFPYKSQTLPATAELIPDGGIHTYSFVFPGGGTKIKSLLIVLPNFPISVTIEGIFLTQMD